MPTSYTSLLGLALPVTGELSGTWGDTVNDYITQYLDSSIAGALTVNADTTLTKTTNAALGSTSSQYAILIASGHSTNITVTAPAASKTYLVINTSGSYTVKIRGAGPTTGVTLAANENALVAWNGSDFVRVTGNGITSVSVASSNGLAGTSSGGVTPALTLSTTVTGIVKGNGTALSAATAGTDYLAPPSGTALLKANSGGALANAVAGTDYVSPTSAETLTNKTLTDPTINNYTEGVVVIGTVSTAATISLTNGTVQTATLTASTACTFTMPAASAGKSFILLLKQAATTGNGSATFTGVKWSVLGAPVITATAGKMDILTFVSDGTNWYGSYVQGYTP